MIQNRLVHYTGIPTYITQVGQQYEMIIDLFFGASIFMPGIFTSYLTVAKPIIDPDFYHHWWQYASIATLYIMVLAAIVKNRRNKLVLTLVAVFAVDILIHVVIGYGTSEGSLYGAHWVFVIPLLIAWFYKQLNDKARLVAFPILVFIVMVFVLNNSVRMVEFYQWALKYYPI